MGSRFFSKAETPYIQRKNAVFRGVAGCERCCNTAYDVAYLISTVLGQVDYGLFCVWDLIFSTS